MHKHIKRKKTQNSGQN